MVNQCAKAIYLVRFIPLLVAMSSQLACEISSCGLRQTEQDRKVVFLGEKESGSFLTRDQLLAKLRADQFDLLIIGGGATGAGAALDAATRGLRTALVEAGDFSSGTSSRSTKLVHGGVRYLENAIKHLDRNEYELVRDALRERERFLANAPHLSHPLPILTPVYSWFEAFYYLVGLKLYDFVAGTSSLGGSEFLSKKTALARFPMMKKSGLKGAVLYYDGQFDDARMNLTLILSAMREGALALNYVRVESLLKENNQVVGAVVRDGVTNTSWPIYARAVINATGVFADSLRKMDNPEASDIMVASQGSHILLPKTFSSPHDGLIIPKTKDGRVIFLLPWLGRTLAGTTEHSEKISYLPKATHVEVDYILDHLKDYFDISVKRADILATWSGLRPLAKPDAATSSTAAISRDHLIDVSPSRLITIVGGKWTTYRKMAEDVVTTAITVSGLAPQNDSTTSNLKLVGARFFKETLAEELEAYEGLSPDVAAHLATSYGDRVDAVIDVKNKSLRERLVEGFPYLEAEVIYAIRHEYAVHAIDVIARRMRLAFLDNHAARLALPKVVVLMAQELFWSRDRIREELTLGNEFLGTMTTEFKD